MYIVDIRRNIDHILTCRGKCRSVDKRHTARFIAELLYAVVLCNYIYIYIYIYNPNYAR